MLSLAGAVSHIQSSGGSTFMSVSVAKCESCYLHTLDESIHEESVLGKRFVEDLKEEGDV